MQEEIEMRVVTMMFNATKFSGRTLKSGVSQLLRAMHGKLDVPHGKQSVRQLARQNQGMTNIEIDDPDIHAFERIARNYGVDFAVKRAKGDETKYLVFFKARDADALTAAFQEYTDRRVRQAERPSLMEILNEMKEKVARTAPARKAERERTR